MSSINQTLQACTKRPQGGGDWSMHWKEFCVTCTEEFNRDRRGGTHVDRDA